MKRLRVLAVLALVALTALTVAATAGAKAGNVSQPKQLTGYFIEWGIYGAGYFVKNVETSGSAAKLTTINYAFGNVAPDGDNNVVCKLGDDWADYQRPTSASESVSGNEVTWPNPVLGNFEQLRELKALHPDLKVLISLGGWTWSKYFSDAAATAAGRTKLVSSCIDLFIKGNLPDPGWGGMGGPGSAAGIFDGVDLDWEWPGSDGNTGNIIRAEDKQNFTLLVKEFRKQLDLYGNAVTKRHYLLTAFLPAAPAKIAAGFEVKKLFKDLDYGTLQGYDYHGPWEATTNHQANLFSSPSDPSPLPHFSVDATVSAYLTEGAPADKLVIGAPFYSHHWTGVTNANNGLFQSGTGAPSETYKTVAPLLGSGYTRYFDAVSGTAWIFNGSSFYTFDDPAVMTLKGTYARERGLGGVMFWELTGDTSSGDLISGLATGLSGS
jgi:chitinase